MRVIKLQLPVSDVSKLGLQAGDKVLVSGELFTARDKAHQRMVSLLQRGEPLPFDLSSVALFYCGPSPVPQGKVCGAIGPTTSSRMDAFTPYLLEHGLKLMIGKGDRSPHVMEAIACHNALYLNTVGGVSAVLAETVQSFDLFAWEEFGAEAIYRMVVKDFPCYV